MPGDGILSIGATVDKTGVEAGLSGIQDGVQATVQSIAVQVEETCARTKAAWNKLGEDVKAAAGSVSAESLKVATATKAQTAAMADLRRASVLSKDAKLDEATSTGILAAAQVKATAASAAVAAAKQEEAASVAASAEEEALSSNVIVAAFQRAALGVRASCAAMQEKLVETAATGKISAEGMTAGFAGLGALLGAGIAAGFAASYIDGLAKMNVELDHLSAKTGIAITNLAGLQQIVKESGGDWDAVATGLVRMDKNLADGVEPSRQLTQALAGIGLTVAELHGLSPEEKLGKLSTALASTSNSGNRAAAAIAVFGRGGAALIPIIREEGAALTDNMQKTGKLTGVTDESAASARRWTQDMAQLSERFRSVMMPVMEHAEDVIRGIWGTFEAAAAAIVSALELVATALVSVLNPLYRFGVLMKDVLTGNWGAIKADAQAMADGFVNTWKAGFAEIKANWKEVAHTFTDRTAVPKLPKGNDANDADAGGDTGGSGSRKGAGASAGAGAEPAGGAQLQQQSSIIEAIRASMVASGDAAQKASADFNIMQNFANRAALAQATSVAAIFKSIDNERAAAMQKAANDQEKNDLKIAQDWERTFTKMTNDLNRNMAKWIMDGGNFGQMMRKSFDSMAQDLIKATLKMGEKWVAHQLLMTAAHLAGLATRKSADAGAAALDNAHLMAELGKWIAMEWAKVTHHVSANAAKTTSDATSAATAQATSSATNIAQTTSYTAVASMAAASAMAGIPIVGPALAAAAAAAMTGIGAGYMAMAAFEQGGVVAGGAGMGVPILAHAGERVLTQSQTTNFEKMVNQSTSNSSSSSQIHFHDHSSWNGVDGASVEGMYRKHAASGRREMMRQMRLANAI